MSVKMWHLASVTVLTEYACSSFSPY